MTTAGVKVLKRIRVATLFLSFIGLGLCGYSIYVSSRKQADKNYKAFCDIDDNISCSKVFTSKYGKGFGLLAGLLGEDSPFVVSNGVYGAIFYAIVIILGEIKSEAAAKMQKYLVLLTNVMSIYLAYILFFVLNDICVVCIATYVLNLLLTVCCFVRVSYFLALKQKKKGKGSHSANANSVATKSSANTKKNNSNKNLTSNKNASQKQNATQKQNTTQKQQNATPKQNASQKQNAAPKQNATQNKTVTQNKNANAMQHKNVGATQNKNQTKNVNQNKNPNQNKNATQNKNSNKPNKTQNSNKSSKKKTD